MEARLEVNDVNHICGNSMRTHIAANFDRIPTYPITATYMGPLGLYLYFKYGRAADPKKYSPHSMHHQHPEQKVGNAESNHAHDHHGHENGNTLADHSMDHANHDDHQKHEMSMHDIHMHEMEGPSRPTWVTVLIGVSHCGAGCVLGDLVGEWLVYGTGVTTNGKDLWPMLLIDYAFALLFGIFFQYFSIAPMSGDYGLKTLIRAAKADILSLTAFEIGLFGWMIAFHVGIWNYRLSMTTWTYWWYV